MDNEMIAVNTSALHICPTAACIANNAVGVALPTSFQQILLRNTKHEQVRDKY